MTLDQLTTRRYAVVNTSSNVPLGGGTRSIAIWVRHRRATITEVLYHGDDVLEYLKVARLQQFNFSLS